MGIKTVSKAIAGGLATAAAGWITYLTGWSVPAETVGTLESAMASGLAFLLGFVVVWLSPANDPPS